FSRSSSKEHIPVGLTRLTTGYVKPRILLFKLIPCSYELDRRLIVALISSQIRHKGWGSENDSRFSNFNRGDPCGIGDGAVRCHRSGGRTSNRGGSLSWRARRPGPHCRRRPSIAGGRLRHLLARPAATWPEELNFLGPCHEFVNFQKDAKPVGGCSHL